MPDSVGMAMIGGRGCCLSTEIRSGLDDQPTSVEHQFDMPKSQTDSGRVYRTARVRLRTTRRQTDRCYQLLRSAGDVWAWLIDVNRKRQQHGDLQVTNYQLLCRELTVRGTFGELSVTGARSVIQRYANAWFSAARRRDRGERVGFPRRKRGLVPVRFYRGTFRIEGRRVRLPIAAGYAPLWVRLARPLPYSSEEIRSITLVHDDGLWLDVTAAVPIEQPHLDPDRVAGVDLGIIHPYAVVTKDAGLLISGRAIRADSYLNLRDRQARQTKAARRSPRRGQRGSRRWRRYRLRERRTEARHRRRVHQAHHQAAKQVIAFLIEQRAGTLVVGDLRGITNHDAGRAHNLRLRQWRRTHMLQALCHKAERAGIRVRLVDEHGTSSTCPACQQRIPKPKGRQLRCPSCNFQGHRELVGAHNIAARAGGGSLSANLPALIVHRRAGVVPARRDRRRHLYDRRQRSCLASGHPDDPSRSSGCRSSGAGVNPRARRGSGRVASLGERCLKGH